MISPWKAALRDPLVHFVLIGALLFAGYRWFGPDPTHTIHVSRATVDGITAETRKRLGHEPNAAEIHAAIENYVEEEALYREALALGLDRGDVIVRRRLVQKIEFLTEDLAAPHAPTDEDLKLFLAQHPENYRSAARYSFRHVYIDRSRHAAPEKAAAQLGKSLRSADAVGGDPFLRGDRFIQQSEVQIADAFGPRFAALLKDAPQGRWTGPLASSYGLHWVYVTERIPEQQADWADVQDRLRTDWRAAKQAAANQDALRRIRAQYQVKVAGEPAP
jgi:hypothetical protein